MPAPTIWLAPLRGVTLAPFRRLLAERFGGVDAALAPFAALAAVGLAGAEAEAFGALSGGAQRLALLARAIVKKPPLLVLDEPCQNLDRPNRERFVALVDRLCDDPAATLLYVTHLADTEPRCITHRLVAAPR